MHVPVLGICPGGPKEGETPHQEVGKIGKGVEHQQGGDLQQISANLKS